MSAHPPPLPLPLQDWALTPGITHLSHGSYGGLRKRVLEAQLRHQVEVEESPDGYFFFRAKPLLRKRRDEVAQAFGAQPGCLVLMGGAMAGMYTVLRSFPWKPGDEILHTNHGYRLVSNGLSHLARKHGVVSKQAHIPLPVSSTREIVQALRAGITSKTKLLVVDHLTSPTGLVFPVKEFIALAREHGIPVLVDGAHAPGHVDLNLASLQADFYVGNLHKWVCAPRGTAFLHAAPQWHEMLEPPVVTFQEGDFQERFLFQG